MYRQLSRDSGPFRYHQIVWMEKHAREREMLCNTREEGETRQRACEDDAGMEVQSGWGCTGKKKEHCSMSRLLLHWHFRIANSSRQNFSVSLSESLDRRQQSWSSFTSTTSRIHFSSVTTVSVLTCYHDLDRCIWTCQLWHSGACGRENIQVRGGIPRKGNCVTAPGFSWKSW